MLDTTRLIKGKLQPLPIPITIQVEAEPLQVDAAVGQRIDAVWEKHKKPHHTDLPLCSLISLNGNRLLVRFLPYRYFFAQRLDSQLQQNISIQPVGVVGITRWGDKVLIGQRGEQVTQYPGEWEFLPSGSISNRSLTEGGIDPVVDLLAELEEESGIDRSQVERVELMGIVFDVQESMWDLCYEIELVGKELPSVLGSEHTQLKWVQLDRKGNLVDFLAT